MFLAVFAFIINSLRTYFMLNQQQNIVDNESNADDDDDEDDEEGEAGRKDLNLIRRFSLFLFLKVIQT